MTARTVSGRSPTFVLVDELGSRCWLTNRDVDVRIFKDMGDDIDKVGRTLISMNEEHRERDFILNSMKNW